MEAEREGIGKTHLSPRTLTATIGINALDVCLLSSRDIWKSPVHFVIASRMTAKDSWTRRKNAGTSVFISTHLFLRPKELVRGIHSTRE